MASSFTRFLDHTQRRPTVGRTPGRVITSSQRPLPDKKKDTHNRQTSMPPVEVEPTISAGKRSQTHSLDRPVIGTGQFWSVLTHYNYGPDDPVFETR
jgi:hypothetical protein